jgi:hypothetical protein
MEQRRLRLGDILDDYCPRERRLTNHAVVAMIEEDVKQTRCTTCDAEHAYKGGKVPKRRKKDTPAALYKEVLAGQSAEAAHIVSDPETEPPADSHRSDEEAAPVLASEPGEAPSDPPMEERAIAESEEPETAPPEIEEGPVHRPLIRAQLPRIEGQKEERRLPEFTIRQRGNGHFRGGDSRMKSHRQGGNGNTNGNRAQGGSRFAGPRQAGSGRPGQSGRGGGQPGFRSGQRQGGGRKRSR